MQRNNKNMVNLQERGTETVPKGAQTMDIQGLFIQYFKYALRTKAFINQELKKAIKTMTQEIKNIDQ